MKKTIKLIVKPSANCVGILRYVNKNIGAINGCGVLVDIVRVDNTLTADQTRIFAKKGVVSLPAMIMSNGQVITGQDSIREHLTASLANAAASKMVAPGMGAGSGDISSYWMRELYTKGEGGSLVARKDEEDDGGIDERMQDRDRERRTAEYMSKVPRNRRPETGMGGTEEEDEPFVAPRRTGGGQRPPPAPMQDNIGDYNDDGATAGDTLGGLHYDDANDNMMLQAMLGNMGADPM